MKILKEIFKRPVTIFFVIILILGLGVFSTSNMAINLLPDISFPYLVINTTYVGADAETIDEKVTSIVEKSMSSVSDVHNLSTYSIDNASIIIMQFDYGTSLEKKENEIEDKLDALSLPSDCDKPVISKVDLNGNSVFSLSLSSDNDFDLVTEKAYELTSRLKAIGGVGEVTITGEKTKSIEITPINGLEMISAFLVSELTTDNSLDIPLGDLKEENGKVSINNVSSAKTIEDISNMMVSISLNSSYINYFKLIQETITGIEEMSTSDLIAMKKDADSMNEFINELESKNVDELDDLVSGITTIKSFVELIENNTASGLKLIWSQILKGLFEDENFKNLTDDELHKMADNYNISYELLKWLQDNSEINPETEKTYAEEKWEKIVAFREANPDDIDESLYAGLFYDIELIPSDIEDENYKSEDEITDAVIVAKKVNTSVLNNIVDDLKEGNEITNAAYANLFRTASTDYKIPLSSYTIQMIRDSHFESNYNVFYNYKEKHETFTITEDERHVIVGDPISSEEFMNLYNQMEFDEPFELKPTARLIEFIRNADFTSSTIKFRINEVADVNYLSVYNTKAYFNGKEAIQIDIYGNSGCNTTSIAKEAKKIIEEFNNENSEYSAYMLNNQADFINDSLSNALVSLLIGMLLAVMVIYLFLRKIKSSLIIAVSMPLSVLLTLGCLYLMGITLNMVSVGGIAVGIGMLVDNSIVVLESITSEKSKGKSVLDASVDGVKLVMGSLIGSTITSICVFFPILFINGLTKEIFADLAYAVMFSLTFSLLVAIFIIPTLFCFFYKNDKNEFNEEKEDGKLFVKIKVIYTKLLKKLLQRKWLTIVSSLLIFILSIGLVFTCSIEFLPSIDQHKIEINISYANRDEASYCQEKTLEAYNIINENIPDIKYSALNVGSTGMIVTSQTGQILLEFTEDAKKTSLIVEDIREALANNNYSKAYQIQEIDGVVASIVGGMNGVSATIKGENVDTLKEIASKIEADVLAKEGIKNASDNMLETSTSYKLTFNKDALATYQVDYKSLVTTLRIGLASYSVYSLEDDYTSLSVNVRFNDEAIGDYYDSLAKFIVGFDEDNNVVYLKDVCDIIESEGRHVIRKSDGLNELTISIESYGIDTNTASKYLSSSVSKILADYDGYVSESGGVSYYLTDAFKGLVIALIISFFLLFGVMACLFESFKKPCIIIFSFPFAFTGGFIALALSNVSLNVVSFIGLIMLMGVIINDAIVLNERIDQCILEGDSKQDAVIRGCKERLRAVLMTTLTTVLALIPMALGLGKGGSLMQPLGVVAIGGMTIGTLVTLILIPSVYCVFYNIKFERKTKRLQK